MALSASYKYEKAEHKIGKNVTVLIIECLSYNPLKLGRNSKIKIEVFQLKLSKYSEFHYYYLKRPSAKTTLDCLLSLD